MMMIDRPLITEQRQLNNVMDAITQCSSIRLKGLGQDQTAEAKASRSTLRPRNSQHPNASDLPCPFGDQRLRRNNIYMLETLHRNWDLL
jgi:hypothetical protein